MAILISDKMDFKTRNITREIDRDGHFIMRKVTTIHQEVITIINVYVPNNRVSHYMKQKLTE